MGGEKPRSHSEMLPRLGKLVEADDAKMRTSQLRKFRSEL